MGIYLDYNATTPINTDVLNYMVDVYKNNIGNADSRTHDYGEASRLVVENARKKVLELLDENSAEVVFTSGATESSNLAIRGMIDYAIKNNKKHIITTSIEHKAVLESAKYLESIGFRVDFVNPKNNGRVDETDIIEKICEDTLLVSMIHVNNETGVIQPVLEIGEYLAEKDIYFHVDVTQSCGKLVDDIRKLKYDMLSFSAHKFYGPQGIGALVLKRKKYKIPPIKAIMFGGNQEKGLRPGTMPVALIAGLGKACEIALNCYKDNDIHNKEIKDTIIDIIEKSNLNITINGDLDNSINSTINICIKGVSSEALMLSTKQYCGISNGSACNSTKYMPSYVLKAMGMKDEDIESSIRISWGHNVDIADVRENFANMIEFAERMVF